MYLMEAVRHWRNKDNYLNPNKYGYRPKPAMTFVPQDMTVQTERTEQSIEVNFGGNVKQGVIFQSPNK